MMAVSDACVRASSIFLRTAAWIDVRRRRRRAPRPRGDRLLPRGRDARARRQGGPGPRSSRQPLAAGARYFSASSRSPRRKCAQPRLSRYAPLSGSASSARAHQADGLVELVAAIGQQIAEVVERVGVGRLDRQHLPQRLLGVGARPRLVEVGQRELRLRVLGERLAPRPRAPRRRAPRRRRRRARAPAAAGTATSSGCCRRASAANAAAAAKSLAL